MVTAPAGTQIQVEAGGAAHADEQRNGQADGGQRIGHVGGGVAQIPHALADEDLVHDVVQGTHQHGQNAGNSKGRQQFGQRLAAQGIFSRHFQGPPSGFVPRRAGRLPAVESEGDAVFCGKKAPSSYSSIHPNDGRRNFSPSMPQPLDRCAIIEPAARRLPILL